LKAENRLEREEKSSDRNNGPGETGAKREHPVTVTEETNRLVGQDPERIRNAFCDVLARPAPPPAVPDGWDGRAADRILDVLRDHPPAQLRAAAATSFTGIAPVGEPALATG